MFERSKYLSTSTSPNNTFLVDQLGLKELTTDEHNLILQYMMEVQTK